MFWKTFDKTLPEKLFIVKNEAVGKWTLTTNSSAKSFLGVAGLRELVLPSTGSLHRNWKLGLVGTETNLKMYFKKLFLAPKIVYT